MRKVCKGSSSIITKKQNARVSTMLLANPKALWIHGHKGSLFVRGAVAKLAEPRRGWFIGYIYMVVSIIFLMKNL
jgi:beta-lactamase class D